MNKQIVDANKKKSEENAREAEEIREGAQKKDEADKRVAKEEETKRKAEKIVKDAQQEQKDKEAIIDKKIAEATQRLK